MITVQNTSRRGCCAVVTRKDVFETEEGLPSTEDEARRLSVNKCEFFGVQPDSAGAW